MPTPPLTTWAGNAKRFTGEHLAGLPVAWRTVNTWWVAAVPVVRRAALLCQVTIDGDATDVEVYGPTKDGAAHAYTGALTLRPHIAHWAEAGVPLAAELMGGTEDPRSNAVRVLDAALAALPEDVQQVSCRWDAGISCIARRTRIPVEKIPTTRPCFARPLTATRGGHAQLHPKPPPRIHYLDLSALEAEGAQLNLVSIDGADLLVDELQKASYLFVGGLGLRSVGDEWLGAGVIASQRATWVITWGLAGILPLIAVAALVLAADALISARETAPLAALFDRRRWLVGVSAWRVWLPVSLAGIVAALAYLVLPMSVSERSASLAFYTPSITFAWVSALLCVVVGLGVALGSAQSIAVAARGWRPGQAEASDATDERS